MPLANNVVIDTRSAGSLASPLDRTNQEPQPQFYSKTGDGRELRQQATTAADAPSSAIDVDWLDRSLFAVRELVRHLDSAPWSASEHRHPNALILKAMARTLGDMLEEVAASTMKPR
jgi:hypothetical protein